MEVLHPKDVQPGMYFNGVQIISKTIETLFPSNFVFTLSNKEKFVIRDLSNASMLVSYEPASQLTLRGE